jgi:hypothetical protein
MNASGKEKTGRVNTHESPLRLRYERIAETGLTRQLWDIQATFSVYINALSTLIPAIKEAP